MCAQRFAFAFAGAKIYIPWASHVHHLLSISPRYLMPCVRVCECASILEGNTKLLSFFNVTFVVFYDKNVNNSFCVILFARRAVLFLYIYIFFRSSSVARHDARLRRRWKGQIKWYETVNKSVPIDIYAEMSRAFRSMGFRIHTAAHFVRKVRRARWDGCVVEK